MFWAGGPADRERIGRHGAPNALFSKMDTGKALVSLVDSSVPSLDTAYSIGSVIGEGRFSKVYSGVGSTSSATGAGVLVALKEIDQCTLEEDEEAIEMLEAEVNALRRCRGTEHVVTLHEVIASQKEECVYLAMERVPGRELFELVEERGALPKGLVCTLVRQLLSALEALARLGVVHRDVKPENLMVTEKADGADGVRLTLIDFGYAALLDEGDNKLLSGVAGSPEYAAPEVLSWLEVEADDTGAVEGERYDAGCDVWSVGVTAHVLLSAELPFELPEEADEASLVAAARNIQLTFAKKVWAEDGMEPAKDFVRQCMVADRQQRPTASALLGHAWMLPESCAPQAPAATTQAEPAPGLIAPPAASPSPPPPPNGIAMDVKDAKDAKDAKEGGGVNAAFVESMCSPPPASPRTHPRMSPQCGSNCALP